MVNRRRRPHADISRLFTPSTIPYAIAATACLFVSYQFSTRIGKPNERVQRRRTLFTKETVSNSNDGLK